MKTRILLSVVLALASANVFAQDAAPAEAAAPAPCAAVAPCAPVCKKPCFLKKFRTLKIRFCAPVCAPCAPACEAAPAPCAPAPAPCAPAC